MKAAIIEQLEGEKYPRDPHDGQITAYNNAIDKAIEIVKSFKPQSPLLEKYRRQLEDMEGFPLPELMDQIVLLRAIVEDLEGVESPKGIVCPFCGQNDFDRSGLKYHLVKHCEPYLNFIL